jgi:RNA polymerase sigma-70 factor (ECF subfamily)
VKLAVSTDRPTRGPVGNQARLAALFDEHYDAVHRYCLARSGSKSLAEDISGETFAEAARWYAQESVDPVSIGWLVTVARRRLLDHWRSEGRRRRRMQRFRIGAELERLNDDVPETDDDVFEALRSLPTRQRAALTLRYLDDNSVSEVAEALECTYQAAESLLARARRSFVKAWEGMR